MKKDNIIAFQIGQRLKEFRLEILEKTPQKLANDFNEDHADEPIKRSQITNWENSPQFRSKSLHNKPFSKEDRKRIPELREYLFWLSKKKKLNLMWALEGKPHRRTKL